MIQPLAIVALALLNIHVIAAYKYPTLPSSDDPYLLRSEQIIDGDFEAFLPNPLLPVATNHLHETDLYQHPGGLSHYLHSSASSYTEPFPPHTFISAPSYTEPLPPHTFISAPSYTEPLPPHHFADLNHPHQLNPQITAPYPNSTPLYTPHPHPHPHTAYAPPSMHYQYPQAPPITNQHPPSPQFARSLQSHTLNPPIAPPLKNDDRHLFAQQITPLAARTEPLKATISPQAHTHRHQTTQSPLDQYLSSITTSTSTPTQRAKTARQITINQALLLFLHSPERMCSISRLLPIVGVFYKPQAMREYTIACANLNSPYLSSQDLLALYTSRKLNPTLITQLIETLIYMHHFPSNKSFQYCRVLLENTQFPLHAIVKYAYILSVVDKESPTGKELWQHYRNGTLGQSHTIIANTKFPSQIMNTLIHQQEVDYLKTVIALFEHSTSCCSFSPTANMKSFLKTQLLRSRATPPVLSQLLLSSTLTPDCIISSAKIASEQIIHTRKANEVIQHLATLHSLPHTKVSDILQALHSKAAAVDPNTNYQYLSLLGELAYFTWSTPDPWDSDMCYQVSSLLCDGQYYRRFQRNIVKIAVLIKFWTRHKLQYHDLIDTKNLKPFLKSFPTANPTKKSTQISALILQAICKAIPSNLKNENGVILLTHDSHITFIIHLLRQMEKQGLAQSCTQEPQDTSIFEGELTASPSLLPYTDPATTSTATVSESFISSLVPQGYQAPPQKGRKPYPVNSLIVNCFQKAMETKRRSAKKKARVKRVFKSLESPDPFL